MDKNIKQTKPTLCPICGEHEFSEVFSYEICPVCGWEDDGIFDGVGSANNMTLEEYKEMFMKKREADPSYRYRKGR